MFGDAADFADGTLRAGDLLARAAGADARVRRRREMLAVDLFLPDEARLDERTRVAALALLRGIIGRIEQALRDAAGSALAADGNTTLAEWVGRPAPQLFDRLAASGLLNEDALLDSVLTRVSIDLIDAALPVAMVEPERPSLMARLTHSTDPHVAAAATALMAAEAERRAALDHQAFAATGLSFPLHQRLTWWTAAAIAETLPEAAGDAGKLAPALQAAARRVIEAHEEADRAELAAVRLAAAIHASRDELPVLLAEAMRDRRLMLTIGLIAHALALDPMLVATAVSEPGGERMWLMLRALDLPRETMTAIGHALYEADPARRIDALPDRIDLALSVPVHLAEAAVAPMRLDPEYRAAVAGLARRGQTA